MSGLGKSLIDLAVRRFRPRWVRAALSRYERFGPIASIGLPKGQRLCVVAPHPDDESIGCGGLLALWAAAGRDATVVFLTSGELGSPEIRNTTDATAQRVQMSMLGAKRRAESEAALALLGARGTWLGGRDGALHLDEDRLVADLAAEWSRAPPDVIAAPYPTDRHPDHAVAARVAGQAAVRTLPQGVCVLGYEIWTPAPINAVLDITAVAEVKWQAIAAHASQVLTTDYVAAARGLNRYRAISSGQKTGFAEAFHLTNGTEFNMKADSLRV